jgi:hypothetical protein
MFLDQLDLVSVSPPAEIRPRKRVEVHGIRFQFHGFGLGVSKQLCDFGRVAGLVGPKRVWEQHDGGEQRWSRNADCTIQFHKSSLDGLSGAIPAS